MIGKIDFSKIVIVRKLSLFEYDQKRTGLSYDDLIKKYKSIGADFENIVSSHSRQLSSFEKFIKEFDNPKVIVGESLTKKDVKGASLIIAFGGDNFFQYVSHFLDNQPVVGINSDPVKSEGSLISFDTEKFIKFLPKLKERGVEVEQWTRLCAFKNGKKLTPLSVSEIFVGARESIDISRYVLRLGLLEEEQKSSGVLISTGTGSTGWYNSVFKISHAGKNDYFPKTSNFAKFIVREPFTGRLLKHKTFEGTISKRQKLEISWLAHGKGIISLDSEVNYSLRRGDRVSIGLSNIPLRVIKQ